MKTWQLWGALAILLLPFGLWPAQAYAVAIQPSDVLILSTTSPAQSITFTAPEIAEGGPANLIVSQVVTFTMPTPAPPILPFSASVALRDTSTGQISDLLSLTLNSVANTNNLAIGINLSSDSPDPTGLGVPPMGTIILDESGTPSTASFGGLDVSLFSDVEAPPSAVPEPGTLALMMSGVVGLVWRRRPQRRAP